LYINGHFDWYKKTNCGCPVKGKAKGKYPDRKLPCASRTGSLTRS